MSPEFIKIFELIVAASLINNFVFTRFLGLCIFFGVSRKMETAVGMSITFTSVMMISAALSWVVFNFVLAPYEITFLKIIVFIGIVAGFVQASDTIMRKFPRSYIISWVSTSPLSRRIALYLQCRY